MGSRSNQLSSQQQQLYTGQGKRWLLTQWPVISWRGVTCTVSRRSDKEKKEVKLEREIERIYENKRKERQREREEDKEQPHKIGKDRRRKREDHRRAATQERRRLEKSNLEVTKLTKELEKIKTAPNHGSHTANPEFNGRGLPPPIVGRQ